MKTIPVVTRILCVCVFVWFALTLWRDANATTQTVALATLDACEPIESDTTWSAGGVYTAHECDVIVAAGATLTLEPGVVVKLGGGCSGTNDSNCAFVVQGRLISQGTAANPVVLTSWRDDDHGGNTNGSGPSSGNPGDWYGLFLAPGSEAELSHTQVYYAGSGQNAGPAAGSRPNRAQIQVQDASLTLQDVTVAYGLRSGIALYGEQTRALIGSTQVISNTGAANTNCPGAIFQEFRHIDAVYRDLSLTDNIRDVVALRPHAITKDITLDGAPLLSCGSSFTLPEGYALQLKPGTLLRFVHSTNLVISPGAYLTATGTLEEPVTFAPLFDDAGDITSTWGGLRVDQGATASFEHVAIRGGGGILNWGSHFAGLWLRSSDVTLRDTSIYGGPYDGLRISQTGTQATLQNVTLRDNARDGMLLNTAGGQVRMSGGAITGNGRDGVRFADGALSGEERPIDQTLIMDGVSIREQSQTGLYVASISSTVILSNTTIADNEGAAMAMHPDNDTPRVTNLTLTDNNPNGLALLNGSLLGERHWGVGMSDVPIVARNVSLTIREQGALTLEPGVTMRLGLVGGGLSPKINVQGNGRLTAIGTPEQPIRFLGLDNTPGRWGQISLSNTSAMTLTHCEIAYGGRDQDYGGMIPLLEINTTGAVHVEACNFGVSWGGQAIMAVTSGDHVIRNSQIAESVRGPSTTDAPLDLRYNWWGHPSGPRHATLNPAGQGPAASGNVLISPWLTASPIPPAAVELKITGPRSMASGQMVTYGISYANNMTTTIESAVLMARLPVLTTYRGSSEGGIFWPERRQVFWKLGDLEPGATGHLLINVQYHWGIPDRTNDNLAAMLVGTNYNAERLDVAPYLSYTPLSATSVQTLSEEQWEAHVAQREALETLQSQASSEGFMWASAERITLNDGRVVMQAILLHPQQPWVRTLHTLGNDNRATTYRPQRYSVQDTTGGLEWHTASDQLRLWGSWDLASGAAWPGVQLDAELCDAGGVGCCLGNCLGKVALNAVVGHKVKVIGDVMTARACANVIATGGAAEALGDCAASLKANWIKVNDLPVLGDLASITECLAQCAGDPNSNDCTSDLITCDKPWYNIYYWAGIPNRTVWRCQDGCYSSIPNFLPCAFGECCMPGVGCVSGEGMDCQNTESFVARDPNEKYGPQDDLLPGDWVDYRIEYENVGEAPAFGVFITDRLDEAFDDSTLQLGPNASYFSDTRLIVWDIGELDPAGQPGATGEVTLTVRLQENLPGGTLLTNQAVVYFPSVPEETPTSVLIHRIAPVVATGQTLTTAYATPLELTLSGREVSDAALSYRIVEAPTYGTLTGTAPNLVYTPMANFTGVDRFSFVANNGLTDSSPAHVAINVTPAGDSTPPTVLWTSPTANASGVLASASHIFTDSSGPLYEPGILIGMSEPLDATTVTTASVTLTGDNGPIAALVSFDPSSNQIILYPREALADGIYSVSVGTEVTDRAGNGLASPFVLRFSIGEAAAALRVYLPLVVTPR
ncbi:right-handed parallel beta-helix repeat-containing protein [Candidatus Viridilinea mediisalina]|uniref:DUF11 domain-containing protein n=1 Tax=Candidatus Viridilinea mediisalina TaxID=2024553 RepID=A0A2A6RN44_9CHLR|nr:right-handed parallel beta-helix repeat-containing protein [Candidatus Viridilinea mediisalina]PDW04270.1 hypothetical protein CJ255_04260 [Candidatus Viridilinea mediisalina]